MLIKDVVRALFPPPKMVKANPLGKLDALGGGSTLMPFADRSAAVRALHLDPYVYIAFDTFGKCLSSAPLVVEERTIEDGELVWRPVDSNELSELLRYPNPREPLEVMMWKTVMSLISGEAYWVWDRQERRLFYTHPGIVVPNINKDTGDIVNYIFSAHGKKIVLPVEDVIHFALPDPGQVYHGLCPLDTIERHIQLEHHYAGYLRDFFANSAVPMGAITLKSSIDDESVATYRKMWNAIHRGDGSHHGVAIFGDEAAWQTISPPLKEIVADSIYKYPREVILGVLGLPPVLAGVFEYANYANADAQIRIFWDNTIIPYQRMVAATLNTQLVREFSEDLRVTFDNSGIPALQDDAIEKAQRVTMLVNSGVMTPNEARNEYGLEPLEGGDDIRTPGSMFSFDTGDDDAGDKIALAPADSRARMGDPRFEYSLQHKAYVSSFERQMQIVLRKYLNGQLNRVIGELRAISNGNQINPALLRARIPLERKDAADDEIKRIFDMIEETLELYSVTDPLVREVVRKSAEKAIREAGISGSFLVDDPNVQAFIEQLHNRLSKINDATYDAIRDVLREAYDSGEGLRELEKRLRDQYKEFSRTRARTIAKTEMGGAVNGGKQIGLVQNGVTKKEYRSAFLDTSRPAHIAADGQVVATDQPFDVGGEMLMFPGDPQGSPGNVINCYCTFVGVTE